MSHANFSSPREAARAFTPKLAAFVGLAAVDPPLGSLRDCDRLANSLAQTHGTRLASLERDRKRPASEDVSWR